MKSTRRKFNPETDPFVTVRVADNSGNVLGWIAANPCRKTGNTKYCVFDWDAVKFPNEEAAKTRAFRDKVTIIAINHYVK